MKSAWKLNNLIQDNLIMKYRLQNDGGSQGISRHDIELVEPR